MGRIHEALRRAEKRYQIEHLHGKSFENFETSLIGLGLGEKQISRQNFGQLKHSLIRLNNFIIKAESFVKFKVDKNEFSGINSNNNFLKILLKRKKFILRCIDTLVTKKTINNISQLVKQISDRQARLVIEKQVNVLKIKEEFLSEEYGKIREVEKNI